MSLAQVNSSGKDMNDENEEHYEIDDDNRVSNTTRNVTRGVLPLFCNGVEGKIRGNGHTR